VNASLQISPQHIQTSKRIADRLPFFGCTSVVYLQIMKSGINCGLCDWKEL